LRQQLPEQTVPADNHTRRSTIQVRFSPNSFFDPHSACKPLAKVILLYTPFHTLHIWLY
jgi:hypothetical protein